MIEWWIRRFSEGYFLEAQPFRREGAHIYFDEIKDTHASPSSDVPRRWENRWGIYFEGHCVAELSRETNRITNLEDWKREVI